jgi:hypothetical protein
MARIQSTGKCYACGGKFNRTAMTRHVAACGQPKELSGSPGASSPENISFHLVVEGDLGTYWLHLAVPATAHLKLLDRFLRDIWLECCGHMSAFRIAGVGYARQADRELDFRGMNVPVGRLLRPRMSFTYEYDFGSTTELRLKVAGIRGGATPGGKVQLLARNDEPAIVCGVCGNAPALEVCTECLDGSQGAWFCEDCAADHDCGIEMLLPVVNSPRVGVCAYAGSEDDFS